MWATDSAKLGLLRNHGCTVLVPVISSPKATDEERFIFKIIPNEVDIKHTIATLPLLVREISTVITLKAII